MSVRLIASGTAVGCAYGAVFAITTQQLAAAGPFMAGFVVAIFAAQWLTGANLTALLLQANERLKGGGDGVDVREGHGSDRPFFGAAKPLNRSQQS